MSAAKVLGGVLLKQQAESGPSVAALAAELVAENREAALTTGPAVNVGAGLKLLDAAQAGDVGFAQQLLRIVAESAELLPCLQRATPGAAPTVLKCVIGIHAARVPPCLGLGLAHRRPHHLAGILPEPVPPAGGRRFLQACPHLRVPE